MWNSDLLDCWRMRRENKNKKKASNNGERNRKWRRRREWERCASASSCSATVLHPPHLSQHVLARLDGHRAPSCLCLCACGQCSGTSRVTGLDAQWQSLRWRSQRWSMNWRTSARLAFVHSLPSRLLTLMLDGSRSSACPLWIRSI